MFLVWKEAKWFIWPASGIPVIRNLEAWSKTPQPKRRESRPSARITCSNSRRDSLLLSLCFVQEMLAVQPPPDMSVQYHHLHREWKCLNMLEHNNANTYVNTEAIYCWFKTPGTWTHGPKTGILRFPKDFIRWSVSPLERPDREGSPFRKGFALRLPVNGVGGRCWKGGMWDHVRPCETCYTAFLKPSLKSIEEAWTYTPKTSWYLGVSRFFDPNEIIRRTFDCAHQNSDGFNGKDNLVHHKGPRNLDVENNPH